MLLISIHPFALRKLLLVIVAFLCFSAFCFADPVLMVRRYSTHPNRLGELASAPASQESQNTWLPRPDSEARQSIDFLHEPIKLEFTQREAASVIGAAPSSTFAKPVRALRPLGMDVSLPAVPALSRPGGN